MFSKLWTIFNNPKKFEEQFIEYLNSFGKIIDKSKNIGMMVVTHRKAVVALTSTTFFTGTATQFQNSNMNGTFVRPQGEHMLVDKIRLFEGAGATINAIAWVPGLATTDVLNGFLSVIENGVRCLPFTAMTEWNQSTTNNQYAGIYQLENPIIWGGQEDINVNFNWFTAPATANQSLQVDLIGMGLFS